MRDKMNGRLRVICVIILSFMGQRINRTVLGRMIGVAPNQRPAHGLSVADHLLARRDRDGFFSGEA